MREKRNKSSTAGSNACSTGRRLTAKQLAFANLIIEGKTGIEAYKSVYNADNMKDSTIYKKANELENNGQIRGYVERAQKRISERVEYDVADMLKYLFGVLDGTDTSPDRVDVVRDGSGNVLQKKEVGMSKEWAAERVIKLLGLEKPEKRECSHSGSVVFNYEVTPEMRAYFEATKVKH